LGDITILQVNREAAMVDLNGLVKLVNTIPNRYRYCVVLVSVICPLCFSFALKFIGFLQYTLVLTGCIVILAVILCLLWDKFFNKKGSPKAERGKISRNPGI
jgi:hypothetical protein